jgi:hypothetical protein
VDSLGIATIRKPSRPRLDQRKGLVALLAETPLGEIVTYAEMGKAAGMPDVREAWHILYWGKDEVRRRFGIEFETVKEIGLKRSR